MRQWLCFKNVHTDGVHIERSVTKLCHKVTTLEEHLFFMIVLCNNLIHLF